MYGFAWVLCSSYKIRVLSCITFTNRRTGDGADELFVIEGTTLPITEHRLKAGWVILRLMAVFLTIFKIFNSARRVTQRWNHYM